MSDCRRTRDLMGPYLYDELQGKEFRLVEAHLAICPECRAEFAAGRSVVTNVPRDLLNPSAEERVRMAAAIEGRAARLLAGKRGLQPFLAGGMRSALAGAMVLALGICIGYYLPRGARPRSAARAPVTISALPSTRSAPLASPEGSHTASGAAPREPAEVVVIPTAAEEEAAPRAESPDRRSHAPARPVESTSGVTEVLRAPRPQGIDDVQVAEVVRLEAIQ